MVRFFVKNSQKWSDFGQILVRFSGRIGKIVSQIFENFSQILIISTLDIVTKGKMSKEANHSVIWKPEIPCL